VWDVSFSRARTPQVAQNHVSF
jgi:hypothetical protein